MDRFVSTCDEMFSEWDFNVDDGKQTKGDLPGHEFHGNQYQRTSTGEESKSDAAKRTHKPSTARKQRRGEAEQKRLSGAVDGKDTGDNEAFDVLVGRHAVEVKTVIDNDNDKITVHPDSRRRKEKYASENGLEMHTVAVDVRGGRRMYYHKPGVGAFRLGGMEKVSLDRLKEILG